MNQDKHIFAIYTELLKPKIGNQIIADDILVHRLKNILRLQEGESVLLFNGQHKAQATIESFNNKLVAIRIDKVDEAQSIKPDIIWLLPILDREAFEQALTFLAVVGVTTIQPLITQKSRRAWGSSKDYERAQKMLIAGCEQSKQFVIPTILPVKEFTAYEWNALPATRLFFDAAGSPLFEALQQFHGTLPLCCFVGPEGDLTAMEKEVLKNQQFRFCALTSNILRAVDAITVVSGMLRTLIV